MEKKKATPKKEKTCFVISPISEVGSDARKRSDWILGGIIEPIAQAAPFSYRVVRSDKLTNPGLISQQVIEHLLYSELIIADLTDHNPNVFYELGIAHTTSRPVISFIRKGQAIPFDNNHVRTIIYDLSDFDIFKSVKEELRKHIEAVEDEGFSVDNPVTLTKANLKLRDSNDPEKQVIANLQSQVSLLTTKVTMLQSELNRNELSKALATNFLSGQNNLKISEGAGLLGYINPELKKQSEELLDRAKGLKGLGGLAEIAKFYEEEK